MNHLKPLEDCLFDRYLYRAILNMCGILGASFVTDRINEELFQKTLKLISHRGPNSSGIWLNDLKTDALGFQRLSIIDLSSNANQPLTSPCGDYKIIFNGEIYNFQLLKEILIKKKYTFFSTSDTEVLLNAYIEWGFNCLNKIDGMFAFAIYDFKDNHIFVARDISGQKPLYYSQQDKNLIFASEIKCVSMLKTVNSKTNLDSLHSYFYRGHIQNNKTIFHDINKLPPAHYAVFNLETRDFSVTNYFSLAKKMDKSSRHSLLSDSNKSLNILDNLLNNSVKNCLVSDVPIGVLLSGGLDSSLIASYASSHLKDLKTFSMIFPNHKDYNEQFHALKVANYLNTDHIEINCEDISPDILEDLALFFDEPFSDPSMIPTYILSKSVKKYCTVVLGGDGGDELFGGYSSYTRRLKIFNSAKHIPLFIRSSISTTLKNFLPSHLKGYSIICGIGDDFNKISTSFDPLFRSAELELLFNKKYFTNLTIPETAIHFDEITKIQDFFSRLSIGDFYSFLSEDVLVKVDRASMANSLEVRSPYLSKEIIEFAFTQLHSDLKLKDEIKKIILKNLGKEKLPHDFIYERKKGFSFPLGDLLLREDWKEFFEKKIKNFESDIINKSHALKLLQNHLSGRRCERKLFAIVQFISWHERYNLLEKRA